MRSQEDVMKGIRELCVAVIVLAFLGPAGALGQFAPESTRFTIGGGPIFNEPTGMFRQNLSNSVGGGIGLLYHIDRTGFFGLRFDVSAVSYGSETRKVPISRSLTDRILLDETTSNSIATVSFGP